MEAGRRYLGSVGVVLVVAQLALFVSAQDCLLAAEGRATPFRDDNGSPRLPSGTQAIITSYKFRCCGNITTWLTYVHPSGGRQGSYDITLQVWRPSPTVQESGCYSMVGENRFTSILLGSGGQVSETPEPSNILTVQPGDVVGYYIFSRRGMNDGIQMDDSLSINSVWYHTNSDSELIIIGTPNCSFPVGTEIVRSLISSTNAAPVLSVRVSSFSCPPTPIISPSTSSSLPPSTTTNSPSSATSISPTKNAAIPANTVTPFNLTTMISTSSLHLSTITNSAYSAITISPTTNAITSVNTNYEGSAALSTAVIASVAAVGGSALLLTLLCTLLLVITIAKVQHKRQRTLAETSSIETNQLVKRQGNEASINTESDLADQQVNTLSMNMQENEACVTTSHTTDNCYANTINTESDLVDQQVNTLSMKMHGNEAYVTTSHITDKCYSNRINTESDLADQQVSTLSMKMHGNEAYVTTSHTTDECFASAINTEYELVYETVKTEYKGQNYEYDYPAEPLYCSITKVDTTFGSVVTDYYVNDLSYDDYD